MRSLGTTFLILLATAVLAAPLQAQQYKPNPYGPDASAPRPGAKKGIATGAMLMVSGGIMGIAEDNRDEGQTNYHPGAYRAKAPASRPHWPTRAFPGPPDEHSTASARSTWACPTSIVTKTAPPG